MRVQDHVREPKTIVDAGRWQRGKIGSSSFPLSRSPIRLGTAWRWRVMKLASRLRSYRLLVAYREDKPNFLAWLALETASGLAVVCCLEDHFRPAEMGLHAHASCGDDPEMPLGAQRYPGMIRLPRYGHAPRRQAGLTDLTALPVALTFFRVSAGAGDLL